MRRVDRQTFALQTDQPTNQPTDTAGYRGALAHLKRDFLSRFDPSAEIISRFRIFGLLAKTIQQHDRSCSLLCLDQNIQIHLIQQNHESGQSVNMLVSQSASE